MYSICFGSRVWRKGPSCPAGPTTGSATAPAAIDRQEIEEKTRDENAGAHRSSKSSVVGPVENASKCLAEDPECGGGKAGEFWGFDRTFGRMAVAEKLNYCRRDPKVFGQGVQ
jgi:hypothetical protein